MRTIILHCSDDDASPQVRCRNCQSALLGDVLCGRPSSTVAAKCREQLKAAALVFLPPERETFALFVDLGVGNRFLGVSLHQASVEDLTQFPPPSLITLCRSRRHIMSVDEDQLGRERLERCGDWFQLPSVMYGDSGQGYFWELAHQAALLDEKLQEFDPGSADYRDYYHYCCQSMHALLGLFRRGIDAPLQVSTFVGCKGGLQVHSSVHFAIQFLLTLCRNFPEADIEGTLLPILLGERLFLDFRKSDPKARAMVISAGFHLMDILQKREIRRAQLCSLLQKMLQELVQEHGRVQEMLKGPLVPKEGVHWHPSLFTTASEHKSYLKMILDADQLMVELILVHIQRCLCAQLSYSESFQAQDVTCWFEAMLSLVTVSDEIPMEIKEASLNVLMMGVHVIQRRLVGEELDRFVQYCLEVVVPVLDRYICWHLPQRDTHAASQAASGRQRELPVLDVAVQLMGELYGLACVRGFQSWSVCEQYALKPFAAYVFQEKANQHHRWFFSLFSFSFLKTIATAQHPLAPSQRSLFLCAWFGQMLDFRHGLLGYAYTELFSSIPELQGLVGSVNWREKLKSEESPEGVWDVIQSVLLYLLQTERNTNTATFLTNRLPQILSAREEEIKGRDDFSDQEKMAYLQKCSVIMKDLLQLRYAPMGLGRPGMGHGGGLDHAVSFLNTGHESAILTLYFTWVFKAVTYLEQAYLDPNQKTGHHLELSTPSHIKQAAQGTPFVCLPEMVSRLIDRFFQSSMDQNSPFLKPLHLCLVSFLEAPIALHGPNPVDLFLLELLASSLDPTGTPEQADVQRHRRIQFVHFILRTYFWHYVEKASHGQSSVDRAVVNGVYFLKKLFACAAFLEDAAFSTLLPSFVASLCRIIKSDSAKDLSAVCKMPVYDLLLQLFEGRSDWIPEPPSNCNCLEIKGSVLMRGGPLQTGTAVDPDTVQKALSILLILIFRSALSVFRFLLPDHVLARADAIPQPSHSYHPITDLEAMKAQGSFAVLFGQYRKPPWVDSITRSQLIKLPALVESHLTDSTQTELPERVLSFLLRFASISETAQRWTAPILPQMQALYTTNCPLIMHTEQQFSLLMTTIQGAQISVNTSDDMQIHIKQERTATAVKNE